MYKKFTLIELLVVIAIIGILASMLLPSLTKARETAKRAVCLNTQKQVFVASTLYTLDYDTIVPMGINISGPAPSNRIIGSSEAIWWPDLLHFESLEQITCPSVERAGIALNYPNICSWRAQTPQLKPEQIADPVNTLFIADGGKVLNLGESNPDKWLPVDSTLGSLEFRTPHNITHYSNPSYGQRVLPRHLGQTNSVYIDGHGVSVKVSSLGFQYALGHDLALWDEF